MLTINQDVIKVKGKVLSVERNSICKVELENGIIITAQPSGRLRKNSIRILPYDEVEVELSPYDLTKGRITYRFK